MSKRKTTKANQARVKNADKFASIIVSKLEELERGSGYKFKSLKDRAYVLNMKRITTRHGYKWGKTSVSRMLERDKKNKSIT